MQGTKLAIWQFISNYFGASVNDVIWFFQSEHRPQKPYIGLNIISGPLLIGNDEEISGEIRGEREITISVNFYGMGALASLSEFQTYLSFDSSRATLKQNNVVFIVDSGVRDLTQLVETSFESRAGMDLRFRYYATKTDPSFGYIGQVEIENGLDDSIVVIEE